MKSIAIIGGGSWGTALALALARSRRPHAISLWVHDAELAQIMRSTRENPIYMPGYKLPNEVEVTSVLRDALSKTNTVFGVVPAVHARDVYSAMQPVMQPDAVFVSTTKGIEQGTLLRMTEVVSAVRGRARTADPLRTAVLSGPSFAREVARGDPTAVVIASSEAALAAELQEEFSGPTFRLYTNDDVIGVELAAALKNVIAIAAGVCDGLGFGGNTVAALLTRGLAEITRLICRLGGRRETLAGLAGIGDLVLTCNGTLSRNRAVGVELGRGRALNEILATTRMVAEGVNTCAAARELARRSEIEMPITAQMYAVLYESKPPRDAIRELMERRLTNE
ncbi:MAG TPA: NAD(P)H-dependent glycerol-3-phosphate dehydrogenase [Candidatus Acidoferrales bacterium]|nr:NAD(P)H-dependent glycerol-3-phosphate dehydrogenase [Candidatus Acidoferrales bacterium]